MAGERHMSDAEALMWAVERDPHLRSVFLNVTFLDRNPDFARFRSRIAAAAAEIPRLRQKVVPSPLPLSPPAWVFDPDFDLDRHVLRARAPKPGTPRAVLDWAAELVQKDFEADRPLWQYVVVEDMADGQAALLAKMHHTITDGVGGVRLSAMFIDLERDPPEPGAGRGGGLRGGGRGGGSPASGDDADGAGRRSGEDGEGGSEGEGGGEGGPGVIDLVGDAVRRPFDIGRNLMAGAVSGLRQPVETAQSIARQMVVTDKAHSPLWRGRASLGRRFDTLTFDLDQAKTAARRLGGTVNDLYVAGVAAGAGSYHRALGQPIDELRMSMPISTRTDRSAGGNAFAPTRVLVPTGEMAAAERFAEVARRLNEVKAERSLGLASSLAGLLTTLPTPLLVRLARSQVETVDFATSNVRGAPFELFIAGARVLANHPMGPTAGTAFNATLLSYLGRLDIGVNIDTGAVDDPATLVTHLAQGIDSMLTATP